MEQKESYILNFFFGEILETPIEFKYTFNELKDNEGNEAELVFELYNDDYHYPIEKEFREFNSLEKKQEVGHNFKACAKTGIIKVKYSSFNSDDSFAYTEVVSLFLQNFVSYLLTFFQRRRIILGIHHLRSGDKFIYSMPPFLAGELVDSVGYGEPLIPYKDTQICLNSAIEKYSNATEDEKKNITMLLLRYNETLNLPYSYERIEAYWRIMEALGETNYLTQNEQREYARIKSVIGMRPNRESGNLQSFIKTLHEYNINYTDDDIVNSFDFRNKTIHEYLNPDIVKEPYLSSVFRFLHRSIEIIILNTLNIDTQFYNEGSYTLIENRVL